jgi:hypothetical protein
MRVLLIHNQYATIHGEQFLAAANGEILGSHGHETLEHRRRSCELRPGLVGSGRAIFTGIHSRRAFPDVQRIIASLQPDIVHVRNVFPLISPWVLRASRNAVV